MADSEDEDLVALGTPFEQLEEDAPRKKPVPIHEQIVTDSQGRRRFHGAFTGGFSAGYFNTVDTKEGWSPSTFTSSRSSRAADRSTQRPEDFMDDEDLNEFGIAPKRVVTTEKFLPSTSEESQRKRGHVLSTESGVRGIIPGDPPLQDLVIPVRMSIGTKLLRQMGWKDGQGVGPRVRQTKKKLYGCSLPSSSHGQEDEEDIYAVGLLFAPKDVETFAFKYKDDTHGIGYSGIDPRAALVTQHARLGMDPLHKDKGSIGIRGQAFGVGAFEEDDDDIYTQDSMSNYDIGLSASASKKPGRSRKSDLYGWTGPPQANEQGGLLSIFSAATRQPPARTCYPPPVVPRDFKPCHKADKPNESTTTTQTQHDKMPSSSENKGKRLTAEERGKMLGETPLPTPKKSVFDYISQEDKSRLKPRKGKTENATKSTVESIVHHTSVPSFSGWSAGSSAFKPYAKEPAKQARYEQFLSGDQAEQASPHSDRILTEWEREREQEDFARSAVIYRPLSQTMAARFTTAKHSDDPSTSNDAITGVSETQEGFVHSDEAKAASMKMFGALTRERLEWHPERVLCKRFNIPDPYPGSGIVGVPKIHREKFSVYSDVRVPKEVKAIEHRSPPCVPNIEGGSEQLEPKEDDKPSALVAGFQSLAQHSKQALGSAQTACRPDEDESFGDKEQGTSKEQKATEPEDSTREAISPKRPSMDLFKAIFAESSSEEDTDESDAEKEENETAVDKPNLGLESAKGADGSVNGAEENRRELQAEDAIASASNKNDQEKDVHTALAGHVQPNPTQETVSPEEAYGPALPSVGIVVCSKQREDLQSGTESEQSSAGDRGKKDRKKKRKKKARHRGSESEESDYDNERHEKRKRRHKREKERRKRKTKHKDKTDRNPTERQRERKDKRVEYTEKSDSKKKNSESLDLTEKRNRNSKDDCGSKETTKLRDYTDRSDKGSIGKRDKQTEGYDNKGASCGSTKGAPGKRTDNHAEKIEQGQSNRVSENRQILDKLKSIEALKEKRRMRAVDFM